MCTTMTQAKEREGQVELAVAQLGGKTVLERERAGTQLSRLLSGNSLCVSSTSLSELSTHSEFVEREAYQPVYINLFWYVCRRQQLWCFLQHSR